MINKEFFDNAEWENECPRNLYKLIDGWSVADSEPVIDGIKDEKIKSIILYMQKSDKGYMAVEFSTNDDFEDYDGTPEIIVRFAKLDTLN